MIQFSKPRRALNKTTDQYRRHEVSAKEALAPQPLASEGKRRLPQESLMTLIADLVLFNSKAFRDPKPIRSLLLPHTRSPRVHSLRRASPEIPGPLRFGLADLHGCQRAIQPEQRIQTEHIRRWLRELGHLTGCRPQQYHRYYERRRQRRAFRTRIQHCILAVGSPSSTTLVLIYGRHVRYGQPVDVRL